jgi:hypothetical protein
VRSAAVWAVLFATAFIARTALDWLLPPVDFYMRSTASTLLGVGLLLMAGVWVAMRSGSVLAGTLIGFAVAAIAALVSVTGAAVLLAIWHDPGTMAAIRASGGLGEVFELPVMMILPGAVLGTLGGVVGATVRRLRSA